MTEQVIFDGKSRPVLSQLCAGDVKACRWWWQRGLSVSKRAGATTALQRLPQAPALQGERQDLTIVGAAPFRCDSSSWQRLLATW